MQMQNGKISLRQYKRLLFFDMVGLGLVILPDLLARHAERAGGCSIFLGALLASLYGGLLLACMRGGVRDRSWLYLPMGSICFSWEPLGYTFWQTWCIPSCCRRSPFSCSQS
ncbi:hypothetical protein [Roseburia sp. AM51-8]|uniref:hypothetical protein n=1 Tax=Roseburia sp. AM51-8 TaxID=2292366 RepID=UPI001314AAD6|nr:hypothetical protein [Roseburia sp. AM51-8]